MVWRSASRVAGRQFFPKVMSSEIQTYNESAAALAQSARSELFKEINIQWSAARDVAKRAAGMELEALNRLRTVGMLLQEASGGRQFPTIEFYRKHAAELPSDFSPQAGKFCASLVRSFSTDIAALSDCREARRALFEKFGVEEAPRRRQIQVAHEVNPFSEFVAWAARFASHRVALGEMKDWPRKKLEAFARELAPMAEAHRKAVEVLG